MPHIHTEPGQHDVTVSAYIMREIAGELRGLVHVHKRIRKLMQIGGHLEINETPMQCLAKEIQEESGYSVGQIDIVQPFETQLELEWGTVQPTPLLSVTFAQAAQHYHDDYIYACMAHGEPKDKPAKGESNDIRWLSFAEMQREANKGLMLIDAFRIYAYIFEMCKAGYRVQPLASFSQALPEQGYNR